MWSITSTYWDIVAKEGKTGRVLRMGGVLDTPTQISVHRGHADQAAGFGSALNFGGQRCYEYCRLGRGRSNAEKTTGRFALLKISRVVCMLEWLQSTRMPISCI